MKCEYSAVNNRSFVKKNHRLVLKAIVGTLLAAFAFFMVLPFLWMLSASFKTERTVMTIPIEWIPKEWHWENYLTILHLGEAAKGKDYHFLLAYWNSIKISVINTCGCITTSALAGYAFAKLRFRGSKALFLFYLVQMMIPSQLTLIPKFVMFSEMGLVKTHLPVILPFLFSVSAVFLMRQSFLAIPDDLRESAKIDGAGEYRIFVQIMVPMAMPTIAALTTVQFLESWNLYLEPLVFLSNWRLHTLPISLNQFVGEEANQYHLVMAACCLTVIPVFIVFLCGQKFFIKGLTTGAVKG